MMSLENKEITGWDKFCHFFSYFLKGITALFTLGNHVYQSTKDEKEAHNAIVQDIKAFDTNGTWGEFGQEYKEKTKVEDRRI
jgi:hypothetical protein